MKYLFNEQKPQGKYHLWNGVDTACRMWSTGGLKRTRPGWVVVEAKPNRDHCHMCRHNHEGEPPS